MKGLLSAVLVAALSLGLLAPASAQAYSDGGAVKAVGLCSAQPFAPTFPTGCAPTLGDKQFVAAVTTSLTQVVAAPSNAAASIRISYEQYAAFESATGGALELEYGTGTNCGTGTTLLQVLSYVPATTVVAGQYTGTIIVPAGKALCAIVSAGTVTVAQILGNYSVY